MVKGLIVVPFRQKLRTLMYRSFKQYYSLCLDGDRRNAARLAGIVPLIADSLVIIALAVY